MGLVKSLVGAFLWGVRFMDTAHTYISKEAKWLPGHDRIWWGLLNDFQYFPYFTNTFIASQCDPKGKIEHEAITTAAATLASYPVPSRLLFCFLDGPFKQTFSIRPTKKEGKIIWQNTLKTNTFAQTEHQTFWILTTWPRHDGSLTRD